MKDFIIDEMVIRECDSLTDPDGNETFRSLDFMSSFIQTPHKLGLNEKIEKKYRDYQNTVKNSGIYSNPQVSRIINRILRSEKQRKVFGTPGNYKSIRSKKCDIQFVGVSIQLKGTLVTNDNPLIKNIHEQGLDTQFTITKVDNAKAEL